MLFYTTKTLIFGKNEFSEATFGPLKRFCTKKNLLDTITWHIILKEQISILEKDI